MSLHYVKSALEEGCKIIEWFARRLGSTTDNEKIKKDSDFNPIIIYRRKLKTGKHVVMVDGSDIPKGISVTDFIKDYKSLSPQFFL
jgi:hypothetical protein